MECELVGIEKKAQRMKHCDFGQRNEEKEG